MCDAQAFIDNLPSMDEVVPNCAPAWLREGLDLFPPALGASVLRVLTAWSIRVCSPAYEPLSPATFLWAVLMAGGCRVAAIDTNRLWESDPAMLRVDELVFAVALLSGGFDVGEQETPALLEALARSLAADPETRAELTLMLGLERSVCVFIGARCADGRSAVS